MNAEATLRKPSAWERAILERLFEADFPGKNELKRMVAELNVRTIDEDGSIELRSSVEGSAPVAKRIPVEAEAKNSDGFTIHVLLHVVGGGRQNSKSIRMAGHRLRSCLMPDLSRS